MKNVSQYCNVANNLTFICGTHPTVHRASSNGCPSQIRCARALLPTPTAEYKHNTSKNSKIRQILHIEAYDSIGEERFRILKVALCKPESPRIRILSDGAPVSAAIMDWLHAWSSKHRISVEFTTTACTGHVWRYFRAHVHNASGCISSSSTHVFKHLDGDLWQLGTELTSCPLAKS